MMAYHRQWRRYHSEVNSLIESSEDEQDVHIFEHVHQLEQQHGDIEPTCSHNEEEIIEMDHVASNSDLEYLSPSDSDQNNDTFESYSDENSADSESDHEYPDLVTDLASWATKSNCTRSNLNELLDILRKQGLRLPKDARTLLQTPRSVNTVEKCGGDYLYLGLETGLLKVIHEQSEHFERHETLTLNFNIDGVPLFKSSSVQLWPILCSIKGYEPFVVSVFCGNAKPSSIDEYLYDFLNELTFLLENGLDCTDELGKLKLKIGAFICDAPARSFLKCIKSHTGYFACERCLIKGKWQQGRVVFTIDDHIPPLRTEQEFRQFEYKDHQVRISPLTNAGLSCIDSFPLDYMHLVCLGVMKRILVFLKQGPRDCKLSQQQLALLSSKLAKLNGKMPREFARQPRSLYYLEKWKATEFRQFLLYTGPLVLLDIVSEQMYKHFLTLTVAMSILLEVDDNFRNQHLDYARSLLVYFVKNSPLLYTETFVTYNVHSLIHLPDDVQRFGSSLNEINAFQYENHLRKIKLSVRKAQNPIAQVAKRITEMEKSKCKRTQKNIPVHISKKLKDSCFILTNGKVVFIKEKRENKTYLCDVVPQSSLSSFFLNPCDSKLLQMYIMHRNQHQYKQMVIEHGAIAKKACCLSYGQRYLIIPMLHGMEKW